MAIIQSHLISRGEQSARIAVVYQVHCIMKRIQKKGNHGGSARESDGCNG